MMPSESLVLIIFLSDGASLKSNLALVKRNASIGADIATAIFDQELRTERKLSDLKGDSSKRKVIIMGGSVVDLIAKPDQHCSLMIGSSTPGTCHESGGGMYSITFFLYT